MCGFSCLAEERKLSVRCASIFYVANEWVGYEPLAARFLIKGRLRSSDAIVGGGLGLRPWRFLRMVIQEK